MNHNEQILKDYYYIFVCILNKKTFKKMISEFLESD